MSESAIFKAAVKLTPERRPAYLDQICGADPELRREVESLLRAHDASGSFLRDPPARPQATVADPPITEGPGTVIGPYKLLQQIGEGGMGVVYMAEQQEPVRRKVALKIIKPGMDSRQVVARFEAERQALAMMDHQNIAKVLDAGTTDNGRPYFVMELVHGIALTKYCDDNKLTLRQRLELFVPICQAIQHAHQKGIIHRDLKPSNILVTMYDDKPVPKVIDFGVAKAVEQRLTEKTLFTQFGTLVGTFEYMSPEQAEMNAFGVDTRSDVYSLGVVLYELLTGSTPLERQRLREAAFGEIVRLIKEEEPPKPSTRLSTSGAALAAISQQRGSAPGQLTQVVRGELDWIVMRCLEKDRTRRYETANGLARDVERYLNDEPVEACPPTAGYKLRKFARKNKKLLVTVIAFAALLLLGVAASGWQAVRATQAEGVANANAVQAEQKEKEAKDERDQAQRQRDEVKALNEKLQAAQAQLRKTLYMAHINLAQHAWDAGNIARVQELLEPHRPGPGETDLRGFEWHYLNRLCHPELLLIKPDGNPSGVACSPDGMRLAAGVRGPGKDNLAKVWDARTGKELLTLKGHAWPITHTTFSPDGKLLATGSIAFDNTVKVWDAQTGKELLTLTGPGGSFKLPEGNDAENAITDNLVWGRFYTSMAFSPDSKRLAGAFPKGVTIVWDARTGTEITRLKAFGGSISFSPDGDRLTGTTSVFRGMMPGDSVFDLQTGKQLLSTYEPGRGNRGNMIFSPDGKKLALIGGQSVRFAGMGKIERWGPDDVEVRDAKTGEKLLSLKGHSDPVQSIAFSPDGARLASASSDKTVKVWDATSGKELFTLKGHTIGVRELGFRPDGKQLVTLGMDGTIRVWDAQPLAFAAGTRGVTAIAASPDGKRVATVSPSGDKPKTNDLNIWDAQTGQQLLGIKGLDSFSYTMKVVFSPDGKRLATTLQSQADTSQSQAKMWDAQTGQELFTIKAPSFAPGATFSPDGKMLALGGGTLGAHAPVRLWDARTGKELQSFKTRSYKTRRIVLPVAFSRDGKRLFAEVGPFLLGDVITWDVQTGEELLCIKGPGDPDGSRKATMHQATKAHGRNVALSPDGKHLAGIDPEGVALWDANTGKKVLVMKKRDRQPVTTVLFSPDGQRLVGSSSGETGKITMWNAQTGEELLTLDGHGPVAFNPDGRRLFGLGPDDTLKIWDATPLPEKR